MTSKARFNSKSQASTSKASSGSGGSKTGTGKALATSGVPSKPSQIQVIFNGKISTPQSLLPRRDPLPHFKKAKPLAHEFIVAPTIEESTDVNEKNPLVAKFSKRKMSMANMLLKSNSVMSDLPNQLRGILPDKKEEEYCSIRLEETETMIQFAMTSFIAPSDTREIKEIEERNARYEAVVLAHKNTDNYTCHPTQTMNNPLKNQNDMASPNAVQDFECQADPYDIKDTMRSKSEAYDHDSHTPVAPMSSKHTGIGMGIGTGTGINTGIGTDTMDMDDGTGYTITVRKFIHDTVSIAGVTPGCLLDPTDLTKPRNPADINKENKPKDSNNRNNRHNNNNNNTNNNNNNLKSNASRVLDDNGASKSYAVDNVNPSNRSGGNSDYPVGNVSGHSSGYQDINENRETGGQGGNGTGNGNGGQGGQGQGGQDYSTGISGIISDNNATNTNHSYHESIATSAAVIQQDTEELLRERQAQETLSAPILIKRLQMLERAVQQNAYHRSHLDYRDLPDLTPLSLVDESLLESGDGKDPLFGTFVGLGQVGMGAKTSGNKQNQRYNPISTTNTIHETPSVGTNGSVAVGDEFGEINVIDRDRTDLNESQLSESNGSKNKDVKLLFRYTNIDLVQGRSVTSMAWNAVNTDLLAVGYGKLDSFTDDYHPGKAMDEELAGGLVLFWSLRNPDYPEKILHTPHPVTALEFSKLSPMILAVGLMNGDVSVYDVKREFNWTKPIESSANMHKGHADPVWQVKWVVKGIERVETLVSISTDGLVLEWNLKKGLVVSTLMQLKRSGSMEGWMISRTAAGLSFDFNPSDPNTYIVGTEDGSIHRCSVSYNEQYLDSYTGHEGPVYRIRFSSRWPQLFMSASADWMIHIYHMGIKTPLLSLRTTNEDFAINDICWCPGNSTIFAAVTANGKLEIWDLASSTIDPVVHVDTNKDEDAAIAAAIQTLNSNNNNNNTSDNMDPSSSSSTAMMATLNQPPSPSSPSPATIYDSMGSLDKTKGITGLHGMNGNRAMATETPVNKLLKNLITNQSKRELTCVQFGERSPTLAIGDNKGTVMVYRILSPQTITHDGPLQQTMKLKSALMKQVDPNTATRVNQLELSATLRKEDSIVLPPLPPTNTETVAE